MFPVESTRNVNEETFIKDVNSIMSQLFSIKSRKRSNKPTESRPFTNTKF